MQVILLKDLKGTGKKGDIVKVSDGYAGNYLFPNKIAIPASNDNLNKNAGEKASENFKKETEKKEAILQKNQLNGITVNLKIKCSDTGKTFGAITSKEVASEVEKLGIVLDKRKIVMDAIKQIGTYSVTAKLHPEVIAKFSVVVSKE